MHLTCSKLTGLCTHTLSQTRSLGKARRGWAGLAERGLRNFAEHHRGRQMYGGVRSLSATLPERLAAAEGRLVG
jgi:hypothetical protein